VARSRASVVEAVDDAVMVEASGALASQVLNKVKTRWRSLAMCCRWGGELGADCRAWTRPRSATSLTVWRGQLGWRSSRRQGLEGR
jgi:hypothetical protein